MKILALDLSSTVIGYAIFEQETENLEHINFHVYESEDLVDKGFEVRQLLLDLQQQFGYTDVVIEERLKKFTAGRTNADAMFKTAQINYIAQFICKDLGFSIKEMNVNTARGLCYPGFHTIARAIKNLKQKEVAFNMSLKILGENFFPKKILKSGPRKGQEVYLDEAMDMNDAWVLGKAYLNSLKMPVKVKKTPVKKKK